jgi:hypothetical protein
MTAIRVIFDGKSFVPQQPVSLPPQSEGLVLIEQGPDDVAAREALDDAVRAYYLQSPTTDADDDAWGRATTRESHRAWDQD